MGTVLDGNYGALTNTRLISPEIVLRPVTPGSPITLLYQHWFRIERDPYGKSDHGYIQVKVNGGDWMTIPGTEAITGYNTTWSQGGADLSNYADSTVRIGFYFTSDSDFRIDNGWYIDDIRIEGIVGISENPSGISLPKSYALYQNYPNSFNPSTTIEYNVEETWGPPSQVKLEVYNLRGQLVRTLVDREQLPGSYKIQWNGTDNRNDPVSSGIYLYRLMVNNHISNRRMILAK